MCQMNASYESIILKCPQMCALRQERMRANCQILSGYEGMSMENLDCRYSLPVLSQIRSVVNDFYIIDFNDILFKYYYINIVLEVTLH
jgi:hypothetical protein